MMEKVSWANGNASALGHLLNVLEELVLFASIRAAERWLDPSEKAATLQLRISL